MGAPLGGGADLYDRVQLTAQSGERVRFYLGALEMLLDRDVPVDMRIPDPSGAVNGRTALMYACVACCPPAVKALLDAKADPNLREKQGGAALHMAA